MRVNQESVIHPPRALAHQLKVNHECSMMKIQQLPQSRVVNSDGKPGHSNYGGPGHHAGKSRSFPKLLKPKETKFIGTLNVRTLTKTGKLKTVTDTCDRFRILILAVQETRFCDSDHFNSSGYRIYKGKPATNVPRSNLHVFGTGFLVHNSIQNSVIDFTSPSERLSLLTVKCANKAYTLVNAHAPVNNELDKNKVEKFWSQLERALTKIPHHHVKILLGDFNAQIGRERELRHIIGSFSAHRRTNANGRRLVNICEMANLQLMSTHFKKPPRKMTTWKSPINHLGEYQIDHVAITRKFSPEIMNVRVRKGYVESDHHLSQIKIRFRPNRRKYQKPKIPRIDPDYLKEHAHQFSQSLKTNAETWDVLLETIQESASKLGQPSRKRKHRWWTSDCDRALETRIRTWNNWHSQQTPENWQIFSETQKQTSKTLRRIKRAYHNKRLEEIDSEFKRHNTRNFYKTFREELTKYNPPTLCFRRPDGTVETNTKANCDILKQHFEKLHNCEPPTEKLQFHIPTPNPDSLPPTHEEIQNIILHLKNHKAPGEDGVIAEMIKLGGEQLINQLQIIIANIFESGVIPAEWKTALIHPLHKKGDKMDPNNYRGISLLSIGYKVLSCALLTRLQQQTEDKIGEYQAGFRPHRSCVEQIWNLKMILQHRQSNTVVTFVDFKKAYDSIDRDTLFNVLREYGVDNKTTTLIQQTLTNTTSKVKFMGEISEPFEIRTGVRQGDGLSPLLFNLVLDKVIKTWEKEVPGINMGTKEKRINIKCLAFADDLAIITRTPEEARHAIEKLHEIAIRTGLHISYEKTQYMNSKCTHLTPLTTHYGNIVQVKEFKYLGEIIGHSGSEKAANKMRTEKLRKAYTVTWKFYNKKSLSRKSKLRHYHTAVLPEALYATETSSLTINIKDIEKIERQILRKIFGPKFQDGIWMRKSSEELYASTERFTSVARKRRMKFYGHLARMDDSRLTKKIFHIINGNRQTKVRWLVDTQKDLAEINVDPMATTRTMYRRKINTHKFAPKNPLKSLKLKNSWTQERRQALSERMRKFWEDKKNKKVKKTSAI